VGPVVEAEVVIRIVGMVILLRPRAPEAQDDPRLMETLYSSIRTWDVYLHRHQGFSLPTSRARRAVIVGNTGMARKVVKVDVVGK
jgi:hypothetical protein